MIRTLKPQTGSAFKLPRGSFLKVIDPEGEQVSDLFCADANDLDDSLSAGRTMDYNESIQMRPGFYLYAHSGNQLMKLVEDFSPGVHDLLVTPCSLQMFQMMNHNHEDHPSCLGNLVSCLSAYDIPEKKINSTLNIFMNIKIDSEGRLKIQPPISRAKDFVVFQAERDLIVGLTACSDEGTNNGRCKPIQYEIF